MSYTAANLLELIDEAGLDASLVDGLLSPIDISCADLPNPGRMFRMDQILNAFRILVENTPDRYAVFRAGRKLRMAHLGAFGLAPMSHSDLQTALEFVVKNRPLSSPMIGLKVDAGKAGRRLVFSPVSGLGLCNPIYPRLLDFNFGLLSASIEDAFGLANGIEAIRLSPLVDETTRLVLEHSGFVVIADADEDAIVVSSETISSPLRHKSAIGAANARKPCDEATPQSPNMSRLANATRAILTSQARKPVTAAVAASNLEVSERSLRRRLAADGANFRAPKHQARGGLPRKLLTETRMMVEDIAIATGFSGVANSRRFFRRASGMSPRAFRQTRGLAGNDPFLA